jgi:hypothetical protein
MKVRWVPVVAVLLIAGALIGYKQTRRPAATPGPGDLRPAVILIADLREAGDSCGCGEIIRAVRAAKQKGLAVRELAPGADPKLEARYEVRVNPAVLLLDPAGNVVERHEGEDADTVDAIKLGLSRMAGAER